MEPRLNVLITRLFVDQEPSPYECATRQSNSSVYCRSVWHTWEWAKKKYGQRL